MIKSKAEDKAMERCHVFFKVYGEQMQNSCYIDNVVLVKTISIYRKLYEIYCATKRF